MQTKKKTGHKVALVTLLLLGVGDLLLLNLVVAPRYFSQQKAEAASTVDTGQAGAETAGAKPDRAETARAEPARVEPDKEETAKADPAKVEPAKAEPAKAEVTKAEPDKAEVAKAEPAKVVVAKAEPAKAAPPTPAPPKPAPVKVAPAPLPAIPNLYFGTGSSVLSPAALGALRRVTRALESRAGQRVSVHGHADERGTPETNLRLSRLRAEAVAQHLVSRGVRRGRITVRAHGAQRPLDRSNTAQAWGKNRRVEIKWK